jgi:23S rRNA (adenine2503-C2)-methyltransferase
MATLPAPLRARLGQAFRIDTIEADEVSVADGGLTEKMLHLLSDGALVESVLMHYPARGPRKGDRPEGRPEHRERHTVCISSQAGCAVGCPFCATGELGFGRNLETAEMLDQVRHAARRLAAQDGRLTNVVFMGMGEPLLNLDRVLEAVDALSDPGRFGLGARHVVVSTSGVVPGIRRLTALSPQFTLAISLHAARDPLRDVLVPLNRRWPVAEVVAAARDHARVTGRRVSYEYVMISGVNDTDTDADALATLLRGDLAHVNLIPMNPVAHTPWQASRPERVAAFAARLRSGGIGATIRRNRGQDAGAACGQLAADRAGEPPPAAVALRREHIVQESEVALHGSRSREHLPASLESLVAESGAGR